MNIIYCGDRNTIHGVLFSILSILKHNKGEIHFYLATIESKELEIKGITDKSVDFLNDLVKNYHKNSFVKKYDLTKEFCEELPTRNMCTRFTPCCMLRLYIDKTDLPDKLLYLDYDVVCRKNIKHFYNSDITNYEVGGVLDYYGKWFYAKKYLVKFDYLNSGVLLINKKKCIETGLFKKCRILCRDELLMLPDQSAINKVAKYKKIFPSIYNDQKRLHKNTVLQHFSTTFRFWPYFHTQSVKPWQEEKMHNILKLHEYDDLIKEFKKLDKELEAYEKR